MPDFKRISLIAVVLLVLLRIGIGWQFFYEGVWKLDTQNTARPWSAEGYLRNARGPFREHFRSLLDDPDDLAWLDYDKVVARWHDWRNRFIEHYGLNEEQRNRLDRLIYGGFRREKEDGEGFEIEYVPVAGAVEIAKLPQGVHIGGSLARAIWHDEGRKRLFVDGERRLTPRERDILLRLARPIEEPANESEREHNRTVATYRKAVEDAFQRASQLSFHQRLVVLLKADPDRVSLDPKRLGDIDLHRRRVERYEDKLQAARLGFEEEHLSHDAGRIREERARLVGPVQALERDLKFRARRELTDDQLARGPMPQPTGRIDTINSLTIWGLIVLGLLLIVGLASRLAAFTGAVMVLLFYLPYPPWPGVPEPPGTMEHSLIVNKNLIEVFALLGIAALPTGQWFGIDAAIRRLLFGPRRPKDHPRSKRRQRKSRGGQIPSPETGRPASAESAPAAGDRQTVASSGSKPAEEATYKLRATKK